MKYLLIALAFISLSAGAQSAESTITLQLTRRAAWYIGAYIKQQSVWADRTAPGVLKNYIGNGNNQDSLFTVTLKAGYVNGMIELLLSGPNEVTQADRLSIINNSPSIVGYTALANQIVAKANGNSSEKQAAIFIRDFYLERLADFANLRTENKNSVIAWANQ